jgi:hypothetical protein
VVAQGFYLKGLVNEMAKKNVSRLLVGIVALGATTSIFTSGEAVSATAPAANTVLEIVPLPASVANRPPKLSILIPQLNACL